MRKDQILLSITMNLPDLLRTDGKSGSLIVFQEHYGCQKPL
jgi:hypothetical protein